MIEFILNNQKIISDKPPTTVLLDFLRKDKRLTGTKEGCREGDCGACTILIGELSKGKVKYKSVNSCLMPLGETHGKHIVTVEGLNQTELTTVQLGMVDEGGTQCGFCTPGFIISMTGYFMNSLKPNLSEAIESLGGNICRCTGYMGIIRAVEYSISFFERTNSSLKHIDRLIDGKFIPSYFKNINKQLEIILPRKKKSKRNSLVISGGTDLYVQRWEELVQSKAEFISDKRVSSEISISKNKIKIGGAVTIQQLLESSIIQKHFPSLRKQLELFGSLPIRNRATVAGNLVNASPIGDITNVLLALDSKIILKGKRNRTIPIRKFYKGYKILDKGKNEFVDSVFFTIPSKKFYFSYEKVSKRTYLDIASVNTTAMITLNKNKIQSIGLSAGGVAPVPLNLLNTCKYLKGKMINSETIKCASEIAMNEISPISDARGSKEYKRLLLRQLFFAHFIKLFSNKIKAEELI